MRQAKWKNKAAEEWFNEAYQDSSHQPEEAPVRRYRPDAITDRHGAQPIRQRTDMKSIASKTGSILVHAGTAAGGLMLGVAVVMAVFIASMAFGAIMALAGIVQTAGEIFSSPRRQDTQLPAPADRGWRKGGQRREGKSITVIHNHYYNDHTGKN